ncbi:hypothetical protein A3L04_08880 [Thermococcus chitonophagus]|uniref:Uncharacterized protein n=1 Tax=Thermococcus chitonophagus TaxID=54262 RepID=A0A160VRX4_9EURY|nr:hypothetical protein [Thermococcus chitonophagus]ASJ17173.1 hypothetical protein A3L04_08880 [Thermococcus chitonophagus]CUX77783.1 hypothetical protein CHITON_1004 [Thermococcus chitonophagus]
MRRYELDEILHEKNIIKKAYLFGFYVGLYGHLDWSGWVAEIRREIYIEARKLGIYEEVKHAYKEGKEAGKKERARRINAGLMKEERERIKGKPKKIEASRATDEVHEFPKKEKVPRILEGFKGLSLPKILTRRVK